MEKFQNDLCNYPQVLKQNKKMLISMIIGLLVMSFVEISQSQSFSILTLTAITSSVMGAWYVVNVNYRHNFMYLFGAYFSLTYSFIAFKYGLYGDFITNLFITFPMCIWGIKERYRNINHRTLTGSNGNVLYESYKDNNNYKINKLNSRQSYSIIVIYLGSLLFAIMLLDMMNDTQPIKDAFTSISTLFAMFLMRKNYKEQWIIWFFVNLVSTIMWFVNYKTTGQNPSLIFMWLFYLINSMIAWYNWNKDYKMEEN